MDEVLRQHCHPGILHPAGRIVLIGFPVPTEQKNLLEKAGIRKDIWTGNAPDPYLQMVALLGSFILFVKQVSWLTYHHLSPPSHRFLCNGFFRGRLLDHSDRIAGDSHSVPF